MSFVKHLKSLVRLQYVLNYYQVVITSCSRSVVEVSMLLTIVLLALDTVTPATPIYTCNVAREFSLW
jgi:hypothetical protein